MKIHQPRDVAQELLQDMEERAKDPKWVYGIPWSPDMPRFNYLTAGIKPKKYHILIARPGGGKSAIAGKWAMSVAEWLRAHEPGKKVKIATFEMESKAYMLRLASMRSGVGARLIESGFATLEQRHKFARALAEIAALPIEYIDSAATFEELERFFRSNNDMAFGVVDHIGLVPGAANLQYSVSALGQTSTRLANLAHQYASILVLAHQNRESLKGEDKRPTQDSVAGADQITKDGDLILGLFRSDQFVRLPEDQRDDPKPGELLLLKNRAGSLGTVYMIFDPTRTDWKEDPELNGSKKAEEVKTPQEEPKK